MVASSYIPLINIRMYVPIFMSIIIIYVDHFLRLSQILNFYVPKVFEDKIFHGIVSFCV